MKMPWNFDKILNYHGIDLRQYGSKFEPHQMTCSKCRKVVKAGGVDFAARHLIAHVKNVHVKSFKRDQFEDD